MIAALFNTLFPKHGAPSDCEAQRLHGVRFGPRSTAMNGYITSRWATTRVGLARRCRVISVAAEMGGKQGTAEKSPRFEVLKISGNGRGTFHAPCPTRFPGRLGGRASSPISRCRNDMPYEDGRVEGTPRAHKSETKWDFSNEIPASVH